MLYCGLTGFFVLHCVQYSILIHSMHFILLALYFFLCVVHTLVFDARLIGSVLSVNNTGVHRMLCVIRFARSVCSMHSIIFLRSFCSLLLHVIVTV